MGNCQTAEAATVVIQHPGNNKVERIYLSVTANEIMNLNPGHYVALVCENASAAPVKQLKLLRPNDTLLIGQVYRLISFEDVLKEFAAKKCVKLGKLLQEREPFNAEPMKNHSRSNPKINSKTPNTRSIKVKSYQKNHHDVHSVGSGRRSRGVGRHHVGGGQWRPALQSIAEIGT